MYILDVFSNLVSLITKAVICLSSYCLVNVNLKKIPFSFFIRHQ